LKQNRFSNFFHIEFTSLGIFKVTRDSLIHTPPGSMLEVVIGNARLTWSFPSHYGPGFDSASNGTECQECLLGTSGCRCVRLENLPLSCADCI